MPLKEPWTTFKRRSNQNYRGRYTDAIKEKSIPLEFTSYQISITYANETDVLNIALFGITTRLWREGNSDKTGNIRDYATLN